jgi:hypothetical protein
MARPAGDSHINLRSPITLTETKTEHNKTPLNSTQIKTAYHNQQSNSTYYHNQTTLAYPINSPLASPPPVPPPHKILKLLPPFPPFIPVPKKSNHKKYPTALSQQHQQNRNRILRTKRTDHTAEANKNSQYKFSKPVHNRSLTKTNQQRIILINQPNKITSRKLKPDTIMVKPTLTVAKRPPGTLKQI